MAQIDKELPIQLTVEEKFTKYKQHILFEYLSDRLNDEQKLVKYFNLILNDKYRNMRRKEKLEEIKQNMLNQMNAARICIKNKDLIISLLDSQLNNYKKLSEHIVSHFFLVKDNLISNFEENLTILKNKFVEEVQITKRNFAEAIKKLSKQKEDSIRRINDQIVCFEWNCSEINDREISAANTDSTNLKCLYGDERVVFKIECEKRVKQLETEYLRQKDSYEKSLLYLRRPDALNRKAEQLHQIIVKDGREISRLNEKLRDVSEKFRCYDDALLFDKRKFLNSRLKEYNSYFKYFKSGAKTRKNKLANLVLQSSKAIQALKTKYEKLKKIFVLINICTRQEKNQKFDEQTSVNSFSDQIDLHPEFTTNELHDNEELRQFLANAIHSNSIVYNLRNSKVRMEIKSFELMQKNLKEENDFLRQRLKRYFESLKQ
jgi:hypothetical protein